MYDTVPGTFLSHQYYRPSIGIRTLKLQSSNFENAARTGFPSCVSLAARLGPDVSLISGSALESFS